MSNVRKDYVIVGYDFSAFRNLLYTEEFAENPDNEVYECYHRRGKIQIFSDSYSGEYLYFGYIVAANNEYEDKTSRISIADLQRQKNDIDYELKQMGWTSKLSGKPVPYQIISFVEWN